eukprot:Em0025g2a
MTSFVKPESTLDRRSVINMIAARKAPSSVSRFLAGESLIALNMNKEGCAPDIRPIAVGETLWRLVGKCVEKVTHGLRICIEEHWSDDDFVAFKGDPLGPLLFALVLHKLISSVDADDECMDLLYQAWYLDDGALAGNRPAVLRAMHIIEEMGPALDLYINFTKCELFSSKGNASFPPAVKCSLLPNLDILGAPVGDYLHCSRFITDKCAESKKLLTSLVDVAGVDLQVAFTLLRMCGGFCKLVHLTRVTPPSLASDALVSFDEDVRQCFVFCSAIEVSDTAWKQAQLSLGQSNNHHLQQAVIAYTSKVSSHHAITAESALASPTTQRELSSKIDEDQFKSLLGASCPAGKARLLSVSAPHSSSWVSVVPSMGLGLHMESNEFQTADVALDPLGHHAVTCRHGGDVVIRHHHLRDVFVDFCRRAHLSVSVEKGHGLQEITATSDLQMCSLLAILRESCRSSGAASTAAETTQASHQWSPMSGTCIPLAVETFCNWGKEAHLTFSRLASHLAISLSSLKPSILADVYSRMNFTRSIARAILAREFLPS